MFNQKIKTHNDQQIPYLVGRIDCIEDTLIEQLQRADKASSRQWFLYRAHNIAAKLTLDIRN